MAHKLPPSYISLITVLLLVPIGSSLNPIITSDKSKLDSWFNQNVQYSPSSSSSLDKGVSEAESGRRVISVRANGGGDFKTITDALKSIPANNKNRTVVKIGPGNYTEKISVDGNKPFVTFYGDPNDMPVLVYGGTALQYGTVDSATLIVNSDYFIGINLKVVNSAPRPDGVRKGAQAAAMRISGDKSAFYNCKFYGFQDTLCDDKGKHFFKDCYIEGTVDFIFGGAKSLYLNSEIHVISGDAMAMITAHARNSKLHDLGYSFVHCKVTGSGGTGIAYLGRAWKDYSRVVYSYCVLGDVVNPQGWSNNNHPEFDKTLFFGEFANVGPASNLTGRASFTKKLTAAEAQQYTSLDFVGATTWLLPPSYIKSTAM